MSIKLYKNNSYVAYACHVDTPLEADLLSAKDLEHEHQSIQFTQSRKLLRLLLSHLSMDGIPVDYMVDVVKSERGKPYLKDIPQLHMSITHTKKYVSVAVSPFFPLGIDIESPAQRKYIHQIAKKVFNAEEFSLLDSLYDKDNKRQSDDYLQQFFSIWTKREALGKAYGWGLLFASDDERFPSRGNEIECFITKEYILTVALLSVNG